MLGELLLLVGCAGTCLAAFDMPLKPCLPLQGGIERIASPNWAEYGQRSAYHDQCFSVFIDRAPETDLFKTMDKLYPIVAISSSPYSNSGSDVCLVVYKDSLRFLNKDREDIGTGRTDLLTVSPNDRYTSMTLLGDKHVMLTTDGTSTGSKTGSGKGTVQIFYIGRDGRDRYKYTTQIFPDPITPGVPYVAGCHADSYAEDTLKGIASSIQPFYVVCMTADAAQINWHLHSFLVNLHVGNTLQEYEAASNRMASQRWNSQSQAVSSSMHGLSVLTYPVHVIGKILVLYRCQETDKSNPLVQVHWCWRRFTQTAWEEQNAALTTNALDVSVMQAGMFIGWSGSETGATYMSKVAYFLDRNSGRLYTLALARGLDAVLTDKITGISDVSRPGVYDTAYKFDIPEISSDVVFYGQVKQYRDTNLHAVDEELIIVLGSGRQRSLRRSPCVQCAECSAPHTYREAFCNSATNQQTVCVACVKCKPGSFISVNCTDGGGPGKCEECRATDCFSGFRQIKPCTGATYEQNPGCTECTESYETDFFQGKECSKQPCFYYPGQRLCSPIGGQFVTRCIDSPRNDTSTCKLCAHQPGLYGRKCPLNHYVAQYCSAGGQEIRDVSFCLPCRLSQCPNNRRLVGQCAGDSFEDNARCLPCPRFKCRQGEFFKFPCVCSKCNIQKHMCLNYMGCDGYGEVDDGRCVNATFACGALCAEGATYEKTKCNETTRTTRKCETCLDVDLANSLGVTHYVAKPCSISSNAVVSNCTARRECASGQYWSPCTDKRDGICMNCTNKVCPYGQYMQSCTATMDSVCVSCNSNLSCLGSGMYRSACALDSPHQCRQCTQCKEGVSYESVPCSPTTNRECLPCNFLGACPDRYYKLSECNTRQDTVCHPCTTQRCPRDTYELSPCTPTSDRVCWSCTLSCPRGQFMSSECTATRNAVCSPCAAPLCEAGKYRTECSGSKNTQCAVCDPPCAQGYFESQSCTPLTNRQCKRCTQCPTNTYELSPCQGDHRVTIVFGWRAATVDSVCNECMNTYTSVMSSSGKWNVLVDTTSASCQPGFYETERCSVLKINECVLASASLPSYAAYNCTDHLLPECVPCTVTMIEKMGIGQTRFPVQYTYSPGTGVARCYYDSVNTPLRIPEACMSRNKCAACKPPCSSGQYESLPCSGSSRSIPASDRECTTCKTCPPGQLVQECNVHNNTWCKSDVTCTCPSGYHILRDCITDIGITPFNATCGMNTPCGNKQYTTMDATSRSNNVCADCPLFCPHGQYTRSPPATTSKLHGSCAFECISCSVCPPGKRQLSACNATHDTTCGECNECGENAYQVGTCHGLLQTACMPCSMAPPGMYINASGKCTKFNDTVPVKCRYHPGDPARSCPLGSYIADFCWSGGLAQYDASRCRPCQEQACGTGYKYVQCSGRYAIDDGKCEICTAAEKCKLGEYYRSDGCDCAPCSVQPDQCMEGWVYQGCDGEGNENDGVCTLPNFECGPECGPEQYEAVACDASDLVSRTCNSCNSVPGEGRWRRRDCTRTSPAEIVPCSAGLTCQPGYFFVACTETSDAVCKPCTNIRCLASEYIVGCSQQVPGDRLCVPRTTTCTDGQYMKAGGIYIDNECLQCSPACVQGVTWEASTCMFGANRFCAPCSAGMCPAGTYVYRNCTVQSDRYCNDCSGECQHGTYMSRPCTQHTDRECRACTSQCPEGYYMTRECNATHDIACASCPTEQQLGCSSLPYEAYATPCGGMTSSRCERCSLPCEAGQTYEARNCSNGHDRLCLACSECLGNQFQESPCTVASNTRCSTCDNGVCAEGSWESTDCKQQDASTSLYLHECKTCSFQNGCDSTHPTTPTYEARPCSGSSTSMAGTDRVCLPCATKCPDGLLLQPCTYNTPSSCVTAEEYVYTGGSEQLACQWGTCPGNAEHGSVSWLEARESRTPSSSRSIYSLPAGTSLHPCSRVTMILFRYVILCAVFLLFPGTIAVYIAYAATATEFPNNEGPLPIVSNMFEKWPLAGSMTFGLGASLLVAGILAELAVVTTAVAAGMLQGDAGWSRRVNRIAVCCVIGVSSAWGVVGSSNYFESAFISGFHDASALVFMVSSILIYVDVATLMQLAQPQHRASCGVWPRGPAVFMVIAGFIAVFSALMMQIVGRVQIWQQLLAGAELLLLVSSAVGYSVLAATYKRSSYLALSH